MTRSERAAVRRDIRRRKVCSRKHTIGHTPTTTEDTMSTTTTLQVGDRVQMDPEYTYLGVPAPDLGTGTVVATEGEYLMGGYVDVEWDENHGTLASRPAAVALRKVEA